MRMTLPHQIEPLPRVLKFAAVIYTAAMTFGLVVFYTTTLENDHQQRSVAALASSTALHHWLWGLGGAVVVTALVVRMAHLRPHH